MSMIEIVHPTQKDMYDKAIRAVDMAHGLMSNTDPVSELLDDIQFYLMAFPPKNPPATCMNNFHERIEKLKRANKEAEENRSRKVRNALLKGKYHDLQK